MADDAVVTSVQAQISTSILTFLIADIRGYTEYTAREGDEAAAALADRFARLVREVVEGSEGRLIELRGDEALAVFNSARQALRSALELQMRAGDVSLGPGRKLHIGVGLDAGEAVPVEDGYRGNALNLAARLCARAGPKEVLASSTVTSLAGAMPGLNYVEKEVAHLKGWGRPTQLFLVQSAESAVTKPPTEVVPRDEQRLPSGGFLGSLPVGLLVGRSSLMAELCDIVETTSGGDGQIVLLAGEAGVGKTRLAQELTVELDRRGYFIAAGSCYETRRSSAYFPFATVLSRLYELAPAYVQQLIQTQWSTLAALIPVVPSIVVGAKTDESGQDRLFWMASHFIEEVTKSSPVAILIDDLHWSDESSLELLRYLAHTIRTLPVLLLATYRNTEVGSESRLHRILTDLEREQLVAVLRVPPLDAIRSRDLLTLLLAPRHASQDVAKIIHERTEGNPLFIQQVARMIRGQAHGGESEDLEYAADQFAVAIPSTVRAVTLQRLARLSEEAKGTLRVASVFGRTFLFDDLLELWRATMDGTSSAPLDGDRLEEVLSSAIEAGVVREGAADLYSFDHAMTQECLYRELSPRRRARVHRAAADVVSRSNSGSTRSAEAAHHYIAGGDAIHALPLLFATARAASNMSAYGEAESHYRLAASVAAQLADPVSLAVASSGLGRALLVSGRADEAFEHLDRAAHGYQELGDTENEAEVRVQGALALAQSQQPEASLEQLESVISSPTTKAGLAAQAYAVQARAFMGLNQAESQVEAASKAETIARRHGDSATVASALIDRATGLSDLGESSMVLSLLEEAISIAEDLGDDLLLSRALNNAAFCSCQDLGLSSAEDYHRRALAAAERSGSLSFVAHGRTVLGMYGWMRGEWTQAMHWFESAAAVASSLRASNASWTIANPGWLLSVKGKEALATRMLEECVTRGEAQSDEGLLHYAKLKLAEQDLVYNRIGKARASAQNVLSDSNIHSPHRTQWQLLSIQAALDSRDAKSARGQLEQLDSHRWREPWLPVVAQRLEASCLALEGQTVAADETFEGALRVAIDTPVRPVQADVLRSWGEAYILANRKSEAATKLREALEVYRELGARPMAESVELELLALNSESMRRRR